MLPVSTVDCHIFIFIPNNAIFSLSKHFYRFFHVYFSTGQRDVQQYKDACAARDRASLGLRGKEHFRKRLEAENERQMKSQEDHESHLLDTHAWQDVNDYVKECNRRKRLSLAFRAKEKRRHADYAKKQQRKKIERQQLDTFYRAEDARHVEMAQLKEKARIALEALEQPFGSFNGNPFDKLF